MNEGAESRSPLVEVKSSKLDAGFMGFIGGALGVAMGVAAVITGDGLYMAVSNAEALPKSFEYGDFVAFGASVVVGAVAGYRSERTNAVPAESLIPNIGLRAAYKETIIYK